jgi:hypothetical protein
MTAGAGLFAYVIQAIGFLHEFRNDPVIFKMGDKHHYYDDAVTFTDNVWEYYFHQPGTPTEKVREYDNHFAKILGIDRKNVQERYDEDFISLAHGIFCEKLKIRREILNKVDTFYKSHMEGMNILSVHKRNYSHYTLENAHVKDRKHKLTMEYYLEHVDAKFEEYDKIFLLTDEEEAYDIFKNKYNSDLIHYDDSKMSPRGQYILDIDSGYKLGEDVLIEALLASKTDHLICGTSNVSVGVRIFNDTLSYDIIDLDIANFRKPRSRDHDTARRKLPFYRRGNTTRYKKIKHVKKISLFDRNIRHVPSYNGYTVPKHIAWSRDGSPRDITVFSDKFIHRIAVSSALKGIKIAWLMEPSAIHNRSYAQARKYASYYDYIMSHDIGFLNEFPEEKRVFVPGSGSSLYEYEWKIYPKTKDILTVVGSKSQTVGHRFRHEVVRAFGSRMDVVGRSCNPFPPEKRAEIYAPYRFQVAIHNSLVRDYWTDILTDCFLTGTVPIVWGGGFLNKYFNPDGYLVFDTLEELDGILTRIESGDIKYEQFSQAIQDNFERTKKLAVIEDYLYDTFFKNLLNR